MRSAAMDFLASVVEGVLDILDGFAQIPARTYFITTAVILAVVILLAVGPAINLPALF